MYLRSFAISAILSACLAAGAARAEDAILNITAPGLPPEGVSLTMEQIEALPQVEFSTHTVWTEGRPEFSGVSLKVLLASVGAKGTDIRALALNDYGVDIPVDSLHDDEPIIATKINGAHFPRREKGPLWIVYPYDSDSSLQSDVIYGRSIWQLKQLSVK